jgi:dTDP-4-dehydrorhamnose 3,5-epimerase
MAPVKQENIAKLALEDVGVVTLDIFQDTRGLLYEMAHESDPFIERIRQVYVVTDPRPDTIRAFHVHEQLHDWFHIVQGSAVFCLVDARQESKTFNKGIKIVLSARKPQLLIVPPGVYHGWMSLEAGTIMVSVASHEYNREKPDEHRVPPNAFDEIFGGYPWQVEAK